MTDETQRCNTAGIAIIKRRESCKLIAYQDPGGILTIGWGHTGPEVVAGLTWSQEQADRQLMIDIAEEGEGPVNRLVDWELTPNQFSALVSFCFNIGQGNFRRSSALLCLNHGDFDGVGAHMALWDQDHAGRVLNGLVARRREEAELFYTPDPENDEEVTVNQD